MSITPSLFDDDPNPPAPAASLVRRAPAFGQSKKGKNVGSLLKQVETLREKHAREKRRLEDALIFHAAQVRPREERVAAIQADVVRALARSLDDRRLSKADGRVLRVILTEQIDRILAQVATPPSDIAELFERLHGMSFEEAVQSDFDDARAEIADAFEAMGVDLDVPDFHPGMTEEEMAASAARMAERMREQYEARSAPKPGRRKTKRELREEARAARREQVRKISIGAVYKRLVKALHPDLEPDPAVRTRKGAVMQDVTTAYAQGDLHTLLRLELECLDGAGADAACRTDETLSAYAEVLREQIARLREEIQDLRYHPRYAAIVVDEVFATYVVDGPLEVQRLDAATEALTAGLARLSDERLALHEVRELIREHRRVRGGGRRPRMR
ncbi:MAG: hypothetical protein H0X67_13570 [Acidobacteria bacterium]|nr:hypothetical protein [Acidobacteriota bacterium]